MNLQCNRLKLHTVRGANLHTSICSELCGQIWILLRKRSWGKFEDGCKLCNSPISWCIDSFQFIWWLYKRNQWWVLQDVRIMYTKSVGAHGTTSIPMWVYYACDYWPARTFEDILNYRLRWKACQAGKPCCNYITIIFKRSRRGNCWNIDIFLGFASKVCQWINKV